MSAKVERFFEANGYAAALAALKGMLIFRLIDGKMISIE
jgi:hypothetical protein